MSYETSERCRPPPLVSERTLPAGDDTALIDRYGRHITYLRMSVTDRCDFRCTYCMAENMRFLPHDQLMSFEEATRLVRCFASLGVSKVRITGGEPLVRKELPALLGELSKIPGIRELALTTNGSQLARHADALRRAGVSSLNISLDSLRAERFARITRTGRLDRVLTGIYAARMAGFGRIRLNCVLMRGVNDDEIVDLAHFAVERDVDLAFIEEMPLGGIAAHADRQMSAEAIIDQLSLHFPLQATDDCTGGPARYWKVVGARSRIGLITPHSNNFCQTCNRVRITARGELYPCLGQDDATDLLPLLRAHPPHAAPAAKAATTDADSETGETIGDAPLLREIVRSMGIKPAGHNFDGQRSSTDPTPKIMRYMSLTGG